MASRLRGDLAALVNYIKKPVDLLDSKFLFRELRKLQVLAKDDPHLKTKFQSFVQENVQKLV